MYLFIAGMRWWRPQRHQTDAVAYIDSIREPVENSAAFMRRSLLVIHAKKSAELSAADVCACVHIVPSSARSAFGLVQAGAAGPARSAAPGPVWLHLKERPKGWWIIPELFASL